MSANIKVSGRVYNGIETISVKDTSDTPVSFGIQSGPPSSTPVYRKNYVTFIDYDGTIVISYTKEEFLALSALPANPTHAGLVAEGWNWTLADARNYVTNTGELVIGQMYHTESGKTEFDIIINEASGFTATLPNTSGTEKDWGDGTTDTLETHTYATAGNYTIKLSGTALPSYINSSKKFLAMRIASGVAYIPRLWNNKLLSYVTIPSSVTSTSEEVFGSCDILQGIVIPINMQTIERMSFNGCGGMFAISIPNSVTSIGDNAFNQCKIKILSIPNSVLTIATYAFEYSGLMSIVIPSHLTAISNMLFRYSFQLSELTIKNGVTTIGSNAFMSCRSLKSVELPSSITSIGADAFYNCQWLTIVTINSTTPPTVSSSSFDLDYVTKIYVPHGTLAAYQADTNWSTYSSVLVELPA